MTADQGWSAVEDTLKLSGWTPARRVAVLRRVVKADLVLSRKAQAAQATSEDVPRLSEWGEQIELLMPTKDVQAQGYAVL